MMRTAGCTSPRYRSTRLCASARVSFFTRAKSASFLMLLQMKAQCDATCEPVGSAPVRRDTSPCSAS